MSTGTSHATTDSPDSPDPTPLPDLLLQSLLTPANASATLEHLAQALHCSPDDLLDSLEDPDLQKSLVARTRLAFLQARCLALHYLPHALAKTITLMNEAEKPEVARRASSSLLQIAGLPTRTSPQPAPAFNPLQPAQPPGETLSDEDQQFQEHLEDHDRELMISAANVISLRNVNGIDLNFLCEHHLSELISCLWNFYKSQNIPCTYGLSGPPPRNP